MKIPLMATRYDLPALFDALKYRVGAEIGVDHGYFSRHLLASSRLDRLYSVDSWQGKFGKCIADAKHYLAEFGHRSEIIHRSASQAAASLSDNNVRLDFAYIDASHREQSVALDMQDWAPLVKPGGCLCGHDYCDQPMTGVIQAVDGFAAERGLPVFVTSEPWASWLIFMPEQAA